YIKTLKPLIEKLRATYFETATAIAFQYFAEQGVEVGIIEAGMGGGLDATNVITPILSIITYVKKDHTDILGNTIKLIAREKAGIIKKGIPCLTAETAPGVMKVFREVSDTNGSEIISVDDISRVKKREIKPDKSIFDLRIADKIMEGLELPLAGSHMIRNAQLAVCGMELLKFKNVNKSEIELGLKKVIWPGRLQIINNDPLTIYDVAHNSSGVKVLFRAISEIYKYNKLIAVTALAKSKEQRLIIKIASKFADNFILADMNSEYFMESKKIEEQIIRFGRKVSIKRNVSEALNEAEGLAADGDIVCIFGSHRLAEFIIS
ncbi:MAG: bifunctional folylpolyglutamate synthase/dihydrofolate synthase, partial [Fidelibacterota bacterium]